MFTGIIEATARVERIEHEGTNIHFAFSCPFTHELKTDQSIAHNGVCLTVVKITDETYTVTAIKETLDRTNLGTLKEGDVVNLERCVKVGDRLDGHIVQGHVDTVGICRSIEDLDGSWLFRFSHPADIANITVSKGSICVNGVSLTVVDSANDGFSVAVIPFTYENTNFNSLAVGAPVNLEFDVVGKYVARLIQR